MKHITDMEYWCDQNVLNKPKGNMPIETMPEGTMIPPITTWHDGTLLPLALSVNKDALGYFITDADGVRHLVKVTWNGHYAESELECDPEAMLQKGVAMLNKSIANEPDELVVELRRIADALETLAKVSNGRTEILVVPPTPLAGENIDVQASPKLPSESGL
jgi:hypothetical protein